MITTMSITDVMRSVHYSCDVGRLVDPNEWLGMIACKIGDAVIPALIDEIMTNGFQDPITLNPCPGGDGYHVGNGHHRLSVMILLGADTILTEIVCDTIFSEHSRDHEHDTYRNPHYNNGDQSWLVSQVLTDHNGERIDVDTDPSADGSDCEDAGGCDCSECRPSSSESSDHDATQPYGTYLTIGPGLRVYIYDPDVMIHTRQAIIPVEIIGQLALI